MITQDTMDTAEEAFGVQGQHIDIHKLDRTHRKILLICEDYPEAVNDRPLLLAKFYEDDWDAGKSLYDNFKGLTRPETVVRRFRDLREWGYVKQSKEADTYNYEAMKNERDKHSDYMVRGVINSNGIREDIVYRAENDTRDDTKPQTIRVKQPGLF